MKKALKIAAIALVSAVVIVAIAFSVLCFNIFSPAKLTNAVNKNAPRFLACDFGMERAELTFFKTFPKVGIDLKNTTLKSGADTLLHAGSLVAAVNIREYLRNNKVIVNDFMLSDGTVNIMVDEDGNPNYNILKTSGDDTSSTLIEYIDLQSVKVKNTDIRYDNRKSDILCRLQSADISLSGSFHEDNIAGDLAVEASGAAFVSGDSAKIDFAGGKTRLDYSGELRNFNLLNGKVGADVKECFLKVDTMVYVDSIDLAIASEVNADFNKWSLRIDGGNVRVGECAMNMEGNVENDGLRNGTGIDVNFSTEKWDIQDVLQKIPAALIGNALDNISVDGEIGLRGNVKGLYNKESFPDITSDISLGGANIMISGFPLSFENIDALLALDMDTDGQTDMAVKSLTATTKKRNRLNMSGTIKNLFGKMLFDIVANGNLHIRDFSEFMPSDFTKCDGLAAIYIETDFAYDPKKGFSLDDVAATADCKFTDVNILYHDTTSVSTPLLTAKLTFPTKEKPYKIDEWLNAKISTEHLKVDNLTDFSTTLTGINLDAYTNDLTDSTKELKIGTTYSLSDMRLDMDTVSVRLASPKGKFVMYDPDNLMLDYKGETARIKRGGKMDFVSDALDLHARASYKDGEDNPLLQWSPVMKISLKNVDAKLADIEHHIVSPTFDVDFTPEKCELKNVNLRFGGSDVHINGQIKGIEAYLKDAGLLKGELALSANYLNLNEILDVIDGFGAPDSLVGEATEMENRKEPAPFIVPFGVDLNMKTTVKAALVEDVEFRNIAGQVYIKDGILVLEEMGLTNDAAKMQLTAMYKTPRLNHLFLGFDFHLLDIKIDKLIEMIPDVDTVLPMLKSFSGDAEFHFAAETYLKSNYDIKFSTLRGAAAISGKDLVVLDSETYRNISKKLLFNKNTENRIDSLSTEITIFKNEVDVYPFLVSIDKYSAVVSGRHNLDMTYDYNISLIRPVRIGLDIIGMSDRLKYKVGKAKYAQDFAPGKKGAVESSVRELKSMISKSLRSNVKSAD